MDLFTSKGCLIGQIGTCMRNGE